MKYYIKINELENIFCYDIYELKEEPFWDKQVEITKELLVLLRRDKEVWFYEGKEDYRKFITNFNEYFNATAHLILYGEEVIRFEQITLLCSLNEYGCYDNIMERLNHIRKYHNPQ